MSCPHAAERAKKRHSLGPRLCDYAVSLHRHDMGEREGGVQGEVESQYSRARWPRQLIKSTEIFNGLVLLPENLVSPHRHRPS